MEEKTLQELNEEYVSLVQEIRRLKGNFETVKNEKGTASLAVENAITSYNEAKSSYEIKKKVFENAQSSGYSEALIESLKDELDKAEAQMDSYRGLVEDKYQEESRANEKFETLSSTLGKQSDRMNLILVSFGGNETINKALVNELQLDFGDKVAEKKSERAKIDDIKTKINDDPKVQANVADLQKLLEDFETTKKDITPDTEKSLAKISEQVKAKRDAIRKNIRKYIGKGGKISGEEIDAMTTARDEKGRFVIAELDRRTASYDKEIGSLVHERDEIINSMAITLEMSKDLENGSEEYQKLSAEILKLEQEIGSAQAQEKESLEKLSKISEERKSLEKERASLGSDVDLEKINRLKEEKAAIEAEKVEMVENPEILEIDRQIAELESKISAGSKGKVETEEYKLAKTELEEAKNALEKEKKFPSTFILNRDDDDVILDNQEYKALKEERELLRSKLNTIALNAVNKDSEFKDLEDQYNDANKKVEEIKKENDEIIKLEPDIRREAFENYVCEDFYPILKQDDSDVAKAFNKYRDAELELRNAMINLQKDPTTEKQDELEKAMKKYEDATETFQEELKNQNEFVIEPPKEAVHNYLLGVLKGENARDEGYDANNVSNRIKILEAQRKKGVDTHALNYLKDSTEDLDNILAKLLRGETVTQEEIDNAVERQADSIDMFEDPKGVEEVLQGTDLPTPKRKQSIFSRIFSKKWPKLESRYDFGDNEPTEEYKRFAKVGEKLEELDANLDEAIEHRNELDRKCKARLAEVLTPEEQSELLELRARFTETENEMKNTPQKINITKLSKLREALQKAQDKFDRTPQYKETEDVETLRQSVNELKEKKAKTPDKVPDPEKQELKEKRAQEKQEEIDKLNGGANVDKANTIKQRLAELLNLQEAEDRKLVNAKKTISEKSSVLNEKKRKISVLEVAKEKMKNIKNLIKIKDANRISDRRSGPIAQELADATKEQDDDGRE